MTGYTVDLIDPNAAEATIAPPAAILASPEDAAYEAKLRELVAALYDADDKARQWNEYRDSLKQQLVDHVARGGEYRGTTYHIDANWKFTLVAQKQFKVMKSADKYKELPHRIGPARFNLISRVENKSEIKYDKDKVDELLTPEEKAYFKDVFINTHSFSYKFEQKTDNR